MRAAKAWQFALATAPVYLLMLWFVSSMVRGLGWAVFPAGLALHALAVTLLVRGRPTFLFLSYIGMMMLTLLGLGMETLLRLSPDLLQGGIANHAYCTYHTEAGGMYRPDARIGNAFRPACRHQTYWNGHWWRHEANEAGYRGPVVDKADAVFLGDSMIYGHGVETDETVSSQYGLLNQCRTANLGRQGACLVEAMVLFHRLGKPMQPGKVFLCTHPNDLDESLLLYSADELQRFVASPVTAPYLPLVRCASRPRPWWKLKPVWDEHIALSLRSAGALKGLTLAFGKSGPARPQPVRSARFVPPARRLKAPVALGANAVTPTDRLCQQVHFHALDVIQHWCQEADSELILFDLGYPHAFSAAMADWAHRHGVTYNPAGQAILDRVLAGEELYLRKDGHWNADGCRAIAEELSRPADSTDSLPDASLAVK